MSENLFSKGQRIMTSEGKDNFDRIFKKKKKRVKKQKEARNKICHQRHAQRN